MIDLDKKVEAERRVQSILRFLSGTARTVDEVAAHIGLSPLETFVLLRELGFERRVVDVTSFEDRAAVRRMWLAAEVPLRTA